MKLYLIETAFSWYKRMAVVAASSPVCLTHPLGVGDYVGFVVAADNEQDARLLIRDSLPGEVWPDEDLDCVEIGLALHGRKAGVILEYVDIEE